jgi:hypothetical protein
MSENTEIGGGKTNINTNNIIKGAILGFIPTLGGAVGFADQRTSKLGKDLEKKIDRSQESMMKKIDRNQESMMSILLPLSSDVAFLKEVVNKKK